MLLVGVALELKCVVETNLIRVNSNKMEHFSYKSGCSVMHNAFKRRIGLSYRQVALGY